jgi:TorA maturation chaperone TorD
MRSYGKASILHKHTIFFTELKASILSDPELESLKVDYTRLFVGMFKLPAPPYGSAYLEDNRIMAESIINVRNWYEK